MNVVVTPEAQREVARLPVTMQGRFVDIVARLAGWPNVSGAKPLRRAWKGHYRIRMGDWRVIFQVVAPDLIVVRVAHRSTIYED